MYNKFIRKICRVIPKRISNKALINILHVLRRMNRRGRMFVYSHERSNSLVADVSEMIEDQSTYDDVYLGMATVAEAGCEVIAAYNVIKFISQRTHRIIPVFSKLISFFEKDGIIFNGKFGVAPDAIEDLLKSMGYSTKRFIPGGDNYEIPSFIKEADAFIMTYYNNAEDLYEQIHTVAVTRVDNLYTAHNVYGNGYVHGPFTEVEELIKKIGIGKAGPIMYISVHDA